MSTVRERHGHGGPTHESHTHCDEDCHDGHTYHKHHSSDACTKVILLAGLIGIVGALLWYFNRAHR